MLNIAGLVIGITLFTLISLLLNYEFSFDGFHPNRKKILPDGRKSLPIMPPQLAIQVIFSFSVRIKNIFIIRLT